MKYKEFFNTVKRNSPGYWTIYIDGIKLDKWNNNLIGELEVIKVELNAYFCTPYEGAGIDIAIYLKGDRDDLR